MSASLLSQVIAITWEQHQRTRALCEGLGIDLHELTHRGPRVSRYWRLTQRTLSVLREQRPRIVLVQNPSLVLALLCVLLRPFLGRYMIIMDAHNEAVEPYINTRWPIPSLARYLLAKADLTIVTNSRLASIVETAGGRYFVLPDRLPTVPIEKTAPPPSAAVLDVMVIATYAPDEPIELIFSAAARLKNEFAFHVTGRDSKLSEAIRSTRPANVRLTGFLPEYDYWKLMSECHIVLDLTLMPECLVCGAYESLSMGRPMVLSDSQSARELFDSVAIFARPTSEDSIVEALIEARACYPQLCEHLGQARDVFSRKWHESAEKLAAVWARSTPKRDVAS